MNSKSHEQNTNHIELSFLPESIPQLRNLSEDILKIDRDNSGFQCSLAIDLFNGFI